MYCTPYHQPWRQVTFNDGLRTIISNNTKEYELPKKEYTNLKPRRSTYVRSQDNVQSDILRLTTVLYSTRVN